MNGGAVRRLSRAAVAIDGGEPLRTGELGRVSD
jgi:hypothetical protein